MVSAVPAGNGVGLGGTSLPNTKFNCAIASVTLKRILAKECIIADIVTGEFGSFRTTPATQTNTLGVNHSWLMMGIHSIICVGISILLGTFNPAEAREEETIIGFTIGFIPLFML